MKCLVSHRLFSTICATLLAAMLGAFQLSAQTQSRYCLGGDLQHLSTAQRASCNAKLADVRNAARKFGAPEGWHFVMVCGEDNWKAYAPFSTRSAQELERASADTDLITHTTYLRQAKLDGGSGPSAVKETLARVLAGIVLQTTDETAIQTKVDGWLAVPSNESGRPAPVLQASR